MGAYHHTHPHRHGQRGCTSTVTDTGALPLRRGVGRSPGRTG